MSEPLLVRCPSCGANNRIPQDKIEAGLTPVCGRCKTQLLLQTKPLTVTDATFALQVEGSPLPVLLDMWAPWCRPCQTLGPIIDELSRELAGKIRVGKLNVDENPNTAGRFGVNSIPTLLVFKAGREVDRIVGVQPKAEIARRLKLVTG
jgi:thioredoxin 2